jgi:hypothetical protein
MRIQFILSFIIDVNVFMLGGWCTIILRNTYGRWIEFMICLGLWLVHSRHCCVYDVNLLIIITICMPFMNLAGERRLRLIIIALIWCVQPHRLNTLNIFTSDFWISYFKLLTLLLIRFVFVIQEIICFIILDTSGTKLLLSFVIVRDISINLS